LALTGLHRLTFAYIVYHPITSQQDRSLGRTWWGVLTHLQTLTSTHIGLGTAFADCICLVTKEVLRHIQRLASHTRPTYGPIRFHTILYWRPTKAATASRVRGSRQLSCREWANSELEPPHCREDRAVQLFLHGLVVRHVVLGRRCDAATPECDVPDRP